MQTPTWKIKSIQHRAESVNGIQAYWYGVVVSKWPKAKWKKTIEAQCENTQKLTYCGRSWGKGVWIGILSAGPPPLWAGYEAVLGFLPHPAPSLPGAPALLVPSVLSLLCWEPSLPRYLGCLILFPQSTSITVSELSPAVRSLECKCYPTSQNVCVLREFF